MPSRVETVSVADDIWEEMLKYMVLIAVSHTPEQSFVGFLGKLLSSGISRALEIELDPVLVILYCSLSDVET